jgi:phenol 2-monooxygenase
MLVAEPVHQSLAQGFPIGKRFKSAPVVRVCDGVPTHLGHHAVADGRWRIYVFADGATAGASTKTVGFAHWLTTAPGSPLAATPEGADADAWFDVKVIYQQDHTQVDIGVVPAAFKPAVGPFGLTDYEKVYATDPAENIFDLRGLDRSGVVVVVRPDQYVAAVVPLDATRELEQFFAGLHSPVRTAQPAT